MKNDLRVFASVALMVLMGTTALPLLAQERQPAPDRVMIERQRTEQGPDGHGPQGPDRVMIEREAIAQGGAHGQEPVDYVFLATEMSFGGKLVKGAPYSAQAVTESVQTLTDGNRIVTRSTAAVYRDTEGRTRREQTLKGIGPFASGGEPPLTVFINDPGAGTSYTLDARAQTARKMTPMRVRVSSSKDPASSYKELVVSSPPPDGEQYKIAIQSAGTNDKRRTEAGMAMGMTSPRGRNTRTESLGKQNIGGVEAEGTRTTVTIPAGEIGNERAIEIISERWDSPELQVIVMTRHSDPRYGENTYQLTNINRSEPSRDLFEVPANYTVIENTPTPRTGQGAGINGGVLNGKAISLPLPEYPAIARAAKASGTVTVEVTIDEEGNVISANAESGHPLLRAVAVAAARQAKFPPTKLSGQPVKVNGVLVYNFVAQ
ncbi:MAG: energy transducer TonB [Acidobacteriota bacterium]